MKALLRTLAILAAALLVIAGLFAFRQTSYGQSLASIGPDRGEYSHEGRTLSERVAGAEGTASSGRAGSNGAHGHGPSPFAAVELLKNLATIAVSVTLVALGTWVVRRGRHDQPHPADR